MLKERDMKIIHISDLHFTSERDIENARTFKSRMIEGLRNTLKGDSVIVLVSGDCVDKGKDYFDLSFNFLDELSIAINDIMTDGTQLKFYCCPGNHDSTGASLKLFSDMYSRLNEKDYHVFTEKNTVQLVKLAPNNLDLILVNSSYNDDYRDVRVNLEHLKRALEKSKALTKIVVLHHPIINSENSNDASLKNAHEFLLLIQEYNVGLILHSHVHQADYISFGNHGCPIVSVGTLLSESGKNINNQFNLLSIDKKGAIKVDNYKYIADASKAGIKGSFVPTLLWESKQISDNQSIISDSFKEIYEKLYNALSEKKHLMNISVHYKNQLNALDKEINKEFPEALIKAKEWQADKRPTNLTFNHGERIYSNAPDSPFDYVLEALKKDYNNRAIIPLYTSKEVQESQDGELPSFTLVQFGFSDDTKNEFVLTLYLRAWEISKFAKINICELYLICEKVKREYSMLRNVNINIFAFRSHIHEDFSCFEKAALDIEENINRVANYVAKYQVEKVVKLLEDKKMTNESVIILDGLYALKKNMQATFDIENEEGNLTYSKELLDSLDELIELTKEIKNIRSKNSSAEAIAHFTTPLKDAYDKVIVGFQKYDKGV